nr:hypothetical protein [Mycoplasmopsis bovis]
MLHIYFLRVFSAFGTSGLTTGITSSLNVGSKIVYKCINVHWTIWGKQ